MTIAKEIYANEVVSMKKRRKYCIVPLKIFFSIEAQKWYDKMFLLQAPWCSHYRRPISSFGHHRRPPASVGSTPSSYRYVVHRWLSVRRVLYHARLSTTARLLTRPNGARPITRNILTITVRGHIRVIFYSIQVSIAHRTESTVVPRLSESILSTSH